MLSDSCSTQAQATPVSPLSDLLYSVCFGVAQGCPQVGLGSEQSSKAGETDLMGREGISASTADANTIHGHAWETVPMGASQLAGHAVGAQEAVVF